MISTVVLLVATLAGPPADSTRGVQAHRLSAASGEPVLDGRLDEPVWQQAESATDFVQLSPNPGAPARQRSEARVVYGSDAIYVAMRMFDTAPDSIVAQLARRDQQDIYSDWAHVGLDSYNDNRTAFRFSVNPRGVKVDAYHFDDSNNDMGWDAVWEAATSVDSLGWTAEFRIPLSQLRYSPGSGGEQVWGIQFARSIARYDEDSFWAPMPANSNRVVSSFGELRGLRGLGSAERLEVQPYTVARVTRAPGDGADPFYRSTAAAASMGADLKYGITSDFTLTATINPDFGQVEADPAVVNLSAYESFFPERRPFFVEGMDIFRFGIGAGDGDFGNEQLFYSRRIGRTPQHQVDAQGGYVDAPDATTILGAAKISGKTASGWSLGVLNAVTARERARFVPSGGQPVLEETTEPLTNYGVLRAIRDFRDGQTAVGGILTTTHRRMEDHLSFLPTASYGAGFDVRHRFGGGDYEIRSWVLGSHVQGDSLAITRLQLAPQRRFNRPDADHVAFDPSRTALGGWAASMELLKPSGGHWSWGGILNARSPGFEVNDLGFQRDADQAMQALFLQYREYEPGPVFRHWRVSMSQWTGWTFGGERAATGGNLNGGFQLNNFWGAHAGINHQAESLAVGALRGGPAIVRPGESNLWLEMYSDSRKPVQFWLSGGLSDERETEGRSWRLGTQLEVRPSARTELALRPSYNHNLAAWQFIRSTSLDERDQYLFGRLEQRTASLTARLSYTFTPELSLQLYAQPFVSAGSFSDFRHVADPRAGSFDARLPRFAATREQLPRDAGGRLLADLDGDGEMDVRFGDPDFNVKQFRSNAVLRWEYRPGSTLFVVWSQGREAYLRDGSFAVDRDFGRLFGMGGDDFAVPATNVLLVKLNYWFNL